MEKDKEVTEVIFRKEKDNSIVALFPYIPEFRYKSCMCYSHIGQHSTAMLGYISDTKPATEEEYKELFDELENQIGYNLKVIKRVNMRRYSDTYFQPKAKIN